MKLKLSVKVPATYYFNKIVDSSIYDIKQQTGVSLSKDQLQGYQFKKKIGENSYSDFQITKVICNELYAYQLETPVNSYRVSYQISPLSTEMMNLEYQEEITGANKTVSANNMFTQLLWGWSRKRRFKKMTKEIEKSYQKFKRAK